MTSLKQRAANRRNALRSTGPRTQDGQRRASINALKHGLTAPIEATPWASAVGDVERLLVTEGLAAAEGHELARRIVEYERNVAFQRERFMGGAINQPPAVGISGQNEDDLDVVGMIGEDEAALLGMSKSLVRETNKLFEQFAERRRKTATREGAEALESAGRYHRRAANQLIKQLKGMGGH